MTTGEIVSRASSQVGYHEKVSGTPTDALYPFRNSYDGADNWTKFHNDLQIAQGSAWCGFFCYWCFYRILGTIARTDAFLHGISGYGGAVSSWAAAFTTVGEYYENGTYMPKPGDLVIFSDTGYPWSHVEFVVDNSGWPNTIETIGGNTRNPGEGGDQSQGMWVARRSRSATATTGFHVRGYCHPDYSDTPSGSSDFLIIRKRRGTAFG